MTVILDQFVQSLVDSGLMTSEEIHAFIDGLPPESRPGSSEDLARLLFSRKKLTKFQAQAIYQGKTKGLVVGNYVVLDKIGSGGMGHVYKARHTRMERVVALKVLPSAVTKSPEAVKRFRREMVAAAKLNHPNIVTAFDADEANGVHFLVMEHVEATTNLNRLPHLTALSICDPYLGDEHIERLKRLSRVKLLVLGLTVADVSDAAIASLRSALPDCKIETSPDVWLPTFRDLRARRQVSTVPPPPAIAPFGAEQARKHQQAWADHLGVPVEQEVDLGAGQKLTMVLIPPGEFMMGSTEEEQARFLEEARSANDKGAIKRIPDEGPRHRVRITRPFRLSRDEVTRGQFRRFVEATGYKTEAEQDGKGGYGRVDGEWIQDPRFVWNTDPGFEQTDEHPVVNVSWNDATAFCQWLSEKEGAEYALPTEAQWEYACRAGTTTAWHCGESETTLEEYAWFMLNAGGKTHPAGQLKPNGWSLYDMHGNVWEWCADSFSWDYYAQSPPNDPSSPTSSSNRVRRGGNWGYPARSCRSADRSYSSPDDRHGILGFRLASVLVDE